MLIAKHTHTSFSRFKFLLWELSSLQRLSFLFIRSIDYFLVTNMLSSLAHILDRRYCLEWRYFLSNQLLSLFVRVLLYNKAFIKLISTSSNYVIKLSVEYSVYSRDILNVLIQVSESLTDSYSSLERSVHHFFISCHQRVNLFKLSAFEIINDFVFVCIDFISVKVCVVFS